MTTKALVRDALAAKKARGERTGKVPFGFDLASDGVTLVANPNEQEALSAIRSMRTQGMTLRAIATAMTTQGIATKDGGREWCHSTIQRLVQ